MLLHAPPWTTHYEPVGTEDDNHEHEQGQTELQILYVLIGTCHPFDNYNDNQDSNSKYPSSYHRSHHGVFKFSYL
jgi:hypothetical protein